jgi:hypothetical protein
MTNDTITSRDDLLVEAFLNGKTLREIRDTCSDKISHQGIRYILVRELGETGYASQVKRNQSAREATKAEEQDNMVETLIERYIALEAQAGPDGDIVALRQQVAHEFPDAPAATATLAFETFIRDSHTYADAERIRLRVRSQRASRARNWTDADLRLALTTAHAAILESGKTFSVQSYNRWAQANNGPTSQTLTRWLAPNTRAWSEVASIVDPTAIERAGRGPAKTWSDEDITKVLKRFVAWTIRNKRTATRSAYEEYTATLKTPTPSLPLLRVRYGTWEDTLASKI